MLKTVFVPLFLGFAGLVLLMGGAKGDAWVPPVASPSAPDYACYTRYFDEVAHIDGGFDPVLSDFDSQIAGWQRRLDDRLDIYGNVGDDRAVWEEIIAQLQTAREQVLQRRQRQYDIVKERYYKCTTDLMDDGAADQPLELRTFNRSFGDPDDIRLVFTATGLGSPVEETGSNSYKAEWSGAPIGVTVRMTVAVGDGLVSDASMSAYLEDQQQSWGERIGGQTVTKTYSFSMTPDARRKDFAVMGAEVNKCGGVCATYRISLTLVAPDEAEEPAGVGQDAPAPSSSPLDSTAPASAPGECKPCPPGTQLCYCDSAGNPTCYNPQLGEGCLYPSDKECFGGSCGKVQNVSPAQPMQPVPQGQPRQDDRAPPSLDDINDMLRNG